MGFQLGLWYFWATAQQILKEMMETQSCSSQAPYQGMILFPNTTTVDSGLGHILPLIAFTKVSEEGSDPPLPITHVDTIDSSSMGEGRPPCIHDGVTTPSTWKIQAQTEIIADLWPWVSECSANHKSSLPCQQNRGTTCNNLSHGEAQKTTKLSKDNKIMPRPTLCSQYLMVSPRTWQIPCRSGFKTNPHAHQPWGSHLTAP